MTYRQVLRYLRTHRTRLQAHLRSEFKTQFGVQMPQRPLLELKDPYEAVVNQLIRQIEQRPSHRMYHQFRPAKGCVCPRPLEQFFND